MLVFALVLVVARALAQALALALAVHQVIDFGDSPIEVVHFQLTGKAPESGLIRTAPIQKKKTLALIGFVLSDQSPGSSS